jgi:ribosomal subunit interface protein
MRIIIHTVHLDITDALSIYIHRRLGALKRVAQSYEQKSELLLQTTIGRSTLHHHKGSDIYFVELETRVPRKTFRIKEYNANVRVAIDVAQKKIKYALSQHKEKTKR